MARHEETYQSTCQKHPGDGKRHDAVAHHGAQRPAVGLDEDAGYARIALQFTVIAFISQKEAAQRRSDGQSYDCRSGKCRYKRYAERD